MQKNIKNQGGHMKIILISPFAMAEKKAEVMNEIFSQEKIHVIRSKQVLVNKELAEKHFQYLPKEKQMAIVNEWSGAMIEAMIIEGEGEEIKIKPEIEKVLYISESHEKGVEDIKLWFPEF